MDVLEALVKGREFLAAHQWGQRVDREATLEGYAYCARGALYCGNRPEPPAERRSFMYLIDEDEEFAWVLKFIDGVVRENFSPWASLPIYNDIVATSKDEVLAVFDRAIDKARKESE